MIMIIDCIKTKHSKSLILYDKNTQHNNKSNNEFNGKYIDDIDEYFDSAPYQLNHIVPILNVNSNGNYII